MPDPAEAAVVTEAPEAVTAPVAEPSEPWFRVDSVGERVGLLAMAVLALGALLPWGAEAMWAWGPFALDAYSVVALGVAVLAALQVASTASLTSNVVTLGLCSTVAAGSVLSKAGANLVTHEPWTLGMSLALLGALGGFVAMEVQRRDARAEYIGMAQRGLELALQPRVQQALVKLLLPFAIAGGLAFFILEAYGQAVANKLAATFVLYWFNPLGKEVGIPFALDGTVAPPAIDPALAWSFIVGIDVITCLFFVWNYDYILKLPYFGRFFAWVERKGNATVVKRPWIRRLAFGGLVLYATLPLEGTGAIGGSVVGRAIGLDPVRTFFAVGLGSVVRTSVTVLIVLGALSALGPAAAPVLHP